MAAEQGDVLLSLSWIYESTPADLSALSLAVVSEVAECLVGLYRLPIKIKWPNDLLLSDAKLAGFIVDVETGANCRVTIGMGLNVASRESFLLNKVDQPITSISNAGVQNVDRSRLISNVVDRLVKLLMAYPQTGFAAYQSKWESHAAYIGEQIILQRRSDTENELIISGVLEGVDEQGCLCVHDQSGEVHKIVDSELSLRLL